MKNKQRSLRQKLKVQQVVEEQLEREIQQIVEEEARKNRAAGGSGFGLTPEQKLVGDNFAQNKKRLPWPVERGIITEHFGIHQHPVLTNVQIRNNGINIATEVGSKVRAVFNGTVMSIMTPKNGNNTVMIKHGNYITIYKNLSKIYVNKGDKVITKQNIGEVLSNRASGETILSFVIYKEGKTQNPAHWIYKM